MVLMCQSVPLTDAVIDVRVRGALSVPAPLSCKAEIASIRTLCANMVELTLLPQANMPFLAGQFVIVKTNDGVRRAYSMSNVDPDGGQLSIIVKHKHDGALSPRLCGELEPGDTLMVEGPYGTAYLREDSDRPVIAVAGGSGLGPMWSIVQRAVALGREVHLYFGVNTTSEACFAEELASIASCARAHLVVKDGSHGGARVGLVGDAVLADFSEMDQADVYMAGPPGMIDAVMRQFLAEVTVDCDRIFFDRFC